MRTTIVRSIIAAAIIACGLGVFGLGGHSVIAQDSAAEGSYAPINGLELYYETFGTGDPLIMLHGGFGGVPELGQLPTLLSENRQVIAVELQGHGHTADIERPLTYESMADDVAALIEYLGFESADVMGYSLGGGVALRTAIQHPDVVRRLILVSTPYSRSNIHPEFLAGMSAMSAESAAFMLETPMYQFYSSVAPDPDNWATLVGKLGELLSTDYDWSDEVAEMTTPTLIILGDSDLMPPVHAVEMFGFLGGGVAGGMVQEMPNAQLAILPNTNHFSILSRTDLLLPIIAPFLDAAVAAAA